MRTTNRFALVCLAASLTPASPGAAMSLVSSSQLANAAQTVYRQDFDQPPPGLVGATLVAPAAQVAGKADASRSPSPALAVDPAGRTAWFSAEFTVPADLPAFVCFDVAVTQPGRLILHFEPAELPPALAQNRPETDWANREKRYDFRAVVSLQPGPWQQQMIDLNHHVFEAVTREKVPYDLAGMRIQKIGFEVNQPAEPNQQVLVDTVRVFGLAAPAQKVDLQQRLAELRSRLAALPADSPLQTYWTPRVDDLAKHIEAFDPQRATTAQWRSLAEQADALLLASDQWQFATAPYRPYVIGIESSLRRISGRNALFGFRGTISDRVQLEAARNEYESFQLVILPLTTRLDAVRVECSDLQGPDGAPIKANNVAAYHQIEQRLQPSLRTATEQIGWTPDALLPITAPFDISDLQTKPIWVTLYVPPDTPPGQYKGRLTIQPSNAPSQTVSLALQVHDFAIPRVGQFRTQGHFALNELQDWYGPKYTPQVRKAFCRLMLEHRFSPTSQYNRTLSPAQEDVPWVMRDGGNVILIGGYHTRDLQPEVIDPAYQWLVENGYIDQAIIYIGDETDDFEKVRAKAAAIRQRWPRLRIMVGGSKPREELLGYVDVWDPITSGGTVYNFDPNSTRQAQARGEEVFWYTCIGPRPPFANVCNDDPLAAIRALWWQSWKYGVTGFEYWWINRWEPNIELSKGEKPWPLSRTDPWNSRTYTWANGDGLLVYPGPDGQPLSCLRFSVLRDAIEDWEVLFMLRRAVELAAQDPKPQLAPTLEQAKNLLDVPPDITTDLVHWSNDPQVYLHARSQVYELLTTLRTALGAPQVDQYIDRWVGETHRRMQQQFEARVAASRSRPKPQPE